MQGLRYSGPSKLSVRYCIDTNVFVDRESHAALEELLDLAEHHWVTLLKSDTLGTDRAGLEGMVGLLQLCRPVMVNESRLERAVLASDEDAIAIDELWDALFPGADRNHPRRDHVRHVMQIATARRYGCDAFVTSEECLVERRRRVCGIEVERPDDAVARIRELRRRYAARGWRG